MIGGGWGMSKQRRWRHKWCGRKVRAPGQMGRSWCTHCEMYDIPVLATRKEWANGAGDGPGNNYNDEPRNIKVNSDSSRNSPDQYSGQSLGVRHIGAVNTDSDYDPYGYIPAE